MVVQINKYKFPWFDQLSCKIYFVQEEKVYSIHCNWEGITYHGRFMRENKIDYVMYPPTIHMTPAMLDLSNNYQPYIGATNHYIKTNMHRKVYEPDKTALYLAAKDA